MNGIGEKAMFLVEEGLQGVVRPCAVASDVLTLMDGTDVVDCVSRWWKGYGNVIAAMVLKGFSGNLRHTLLEHPRKSGTGLFGHDFLRHPLKLGTDGFGLRFGGDDIFEDLGKLAKGLGLLVSDFDERGSRRRVFEGVNQIPSGIEGFIGRGCLRFWYMCWEEVDGVRDADASGVGNPSGVATIMVEGWSKVPAREAMEGPSLVVLVVNNDFGTRGRERCTVKIKIAFEMGVGRKLGI
jgi:hypothetical protein